MRRRSLAREYHQAGKVLEESRAADGAAGRADQYQCEQQYGLDPTAASAVDGNALGSVRRDSRRAIRVADPDRSEDHLDQIILDFANYRAFAGVSTASACTGDDF